MPNTKARLRKNVGERGKPGKIGSLPWDENSANLASLNPSQSEDMAVDTLELETAVTSSNDEHDAVST